MDMDMDMDMDVDVDMDKNNTEGIRITSMDENLCTLPDVSLYYDE